MSEINTQNHWIIITNPKAGKQMFSKQEFLKKELENTTIPHTIIETQHAGHPITLATEYANKGYTHFLIWGGDGTINEVINGLFHSNVEDKSKLTVAFIPRGTGNDWARFWKLNKYKYKQAWKIFQAGKTRPIDIGRAEITDTYGIRNQYFINAIGLGLDAEIADLAIRLKKYLGSHTFLYTLGLIMAVFTYKAVPSKFEINEEKEDMSLFSMSIANGPYSGGGIRQNPDAVPYDGLFDVMYLAKPTLKQVLSVLPHIFDGKINQHKIIRTYKTPKIVFESNHKFIIETDGIVFRNLEKCIVNNMKNAINLVVAEEFL